MEFLSGKNLLITGLLNKRSIAYGVAKAAQREGASLAFAYQNERVRGSVESLAAQLSCSIVLPCDVSSDAQIAALFAALRTRWQSLDGLLHAIAYAAHPGSVALAVRGHAVCRRRARSAHGGFRRALPRILARACRHGGGVTVRASPADYAALAQRREDPDTLFFSRRLVLEGDTALGLALKNALDRLD